MFLVLCLLFTVGTSVVIDGTVRLFSGLPNPTAKTCNGVLLETQIAPNPSTHAFTFVTVLESTGQYCVQIDWTASNVHSIAQVNGYMVRQSGHSGNGGGIQLAMPVKRNANYILSGSQVGVIYPGCGTPGGPNEYNLHTFTVSPPSATDTLEGTGIAFNVKC